MKRAHNRKGFSLLELLTVIAIIAMLAAVLFPIFRAVKDKARMTGCISNLHTIGVALQQYKLDNNRYPLCLLGYYNDADKNMDMCKGQSLFPEYVKSIDTFTCPAASAGDNNSSVTVSVLDPMTFAEVPVSYYFGDSYDWGNLGWPQVTATYRRAWAPPDATTGGVNLAAVANFQPYFVPDSPEKQAEDYARQLRFRSPEATTVVTWCLNHGYANKAVVLFLGGNVVSVDIDKMKPTGAGGSQVMYRALPK